MEAFISLTNFQKLHSRVAMTNLSYQTCHVAISHIEAQTLVVKLEQAFHMFKNSSLVTDYLQQVLSNRVDKSKISSVAISMIYCVSKPGFTQRSIGMHTR
jgi:hypothetical protein